MMTASFKAPVRLALLLLLTLCVRLAHGDVSISKPLTGQTYEVSDGVAKVSVTWIESNAQPKLTDIESYTFVLCTGPNANIKAVKTLAKQIKASDISGYTYDLSIDSDVGQDGYYYIQIYATATNGWTIHYSNRFMLEGMTGSYEPTVGAVTKPPDAQTSLANGDNTMVSIDSKSFSVPYLSQTGRTRYAPMQTQPPTKITMDKSSWTRRFPTSEVSYFTSVSSSLAQVTTITPGWSYTISSGVNWASHAPDPSANGGWYAASERLTRTPTLTQAAHTPEAIVSTSTS